MPELVALSRCCTVSEAELVAVCAEPQLVRRLVQELLGKPQPEQLVERTRVAANPWGVRRRASPPFVCARTQRPSKLATAVSEHGCSSSTVTQKHGRRHTGHGDVRPGRPAQRPRYPKNQEQRVT